MASDTQLINSIRRQVADYEPDQKYGKEYYEDALNFARRKLNFDLGLEYATNQEVIDNHTFLLEKLASIQMCYVRAAESAEGESGDGDPTRYTSVAVPDLSVTDNSSQQSRGAAFWMDLARKLQSEYDGEVGDNKAGQNTGGQVEQGFTRKISLTNGGYIKRKLDVGLSAVSPTSLVDGNDVMISWGKLFAPDFLSYQVFRDVSITMKDELIVNVQSDNHITEFIDLEVVSGTYFYRVKTVNGNEIKTNSITLTVVVP